MISLCSADKYQYWRLSANHKAFFYGDCGETDAPTLEQLPNKLAVHEITELLTGRSCTHMKNARAKVGHSARTRRTLAPR